MGDLLATVDMDGGPEGNQTVLRGAAPKDSLITQGTNLGIFFQTNLNVIIIN